MEFDPLPPRKPGDFRLVHLTDLHVSHGDYPIRGEVRRWFGRNDDDNAGMLRAVAKDIEKIDPDHLVVTGDITNRGQPSEFEEAMEILKPFDRYDRLTVIPGNHDVAYKKRWGKNVPMIGGKKLTLSERKFAHFLDRFSHLIPAAYPPVLGLGRRRSFFPFVKILEEPGICFIGIDTTSRFSTKMLALNSVGNVGAPQMRELGRLLRNPGIAGMKVVALMHHHPMVIPHLYPGESLRALRRGAKLLTTLYEGGVEVILHGHKHHPFCWRSQSLHRKELVVVCAAPPGQMGVDNPSKEFPLIYNIYTISKDDFTIHHRQIPFRRAK